MTAARPKVVVSSRVEPGSLEPLAGRAELVVNEAAEPWPRGALLARAADAYGLIAFMTDSIDEALLQACPALRIVAGALKGHDNLDAGACSRHGVWLTVVPDLLTEPTADLAVGLLLALSRNLVEGDRLVRGGGFAGWRPQLYGRGLAGATVGLLGMGAVGRAIARRLTGFGCRLAYADPRPLPAEEARALGAERGSPESLAAGSDVLILALPLTAATAGLVGRRFLERVRPGCLLVNPARGSLVDEEAVADALESGRLGGYAADVFAFEDRARPGRPEGIPPRLLADGRRTVLTPHLGSAVAALRREIVAEAARNILDCLEGRVPRGAVNAPEPRTGALP
ncbi:phosphonate dehydrogenase [Tistlia consotensis]|uniref:Phosphonate dehydrogenase n=1 Tax=Tistlia consotensis USBA 355 TaxID=560819 RepID=A0A1Y6CDD1_9PROT|nr:NAD(P)-dependent oxidoreductase [Tistlia consotensis]SMF55702.1 phosphonate dehydrogenase [Tistlia consotensis USBA 355]SNR89055.1 phosphonate dehydrogenase [Tistlia consotensis]